MKKYVIFIISLLLLSGCGSIPRNPAILDAPRTQTSPMENELLSIPTDSDFARDSRIDQSNILTSNGLITEDLVSSFQIDTIVELAVATTIKKLFFNNYYLDLIEAYSFTWYLVPPLR